jgi:hypothetical protein
MIVETELAYGLRQMIAEQGASIVYRQRTTLPGANPAPNPPTFINLVLDGATSAGAGTVNLKADIFTGRLIAGDILVFDGDPTEYTVTGEVISSTTSNDLVAVPITPTLVGDLDDLTSVTVTYIADTSLQALVTNTPDQLINGTAIVASGHRVRFLSADLTGAVTIGDEVLLPGGITEEVTKPSRMENQGVQYGWTLQTGA